ncbi:MAG: hypothetical protein J5643_04540 [Lachnospiraceae bacterium]|nr:hypothetical protein [Lachnospiraceae bacterium]
MRKMRLPALLLSLTLLCGCTQKPTAAPSATGTPTPTPTPVPEPNYSFSVNTDERFQEIDGFGAGYTWYADQILDHGHADEVFNLLFGEGGMTILRFKNEYGYTKFETSAQTNLAFYEGAKKYADARGEEVTVLYTSWSPAGGTKSNGSVNGHGTLIKDADGQFVYDKFAAWWTEGVAAYREKGIPVDVVSIQNECDYAVTYDGCEFDPQEGNNASYAKAFLATYAAFQEAFGPDIPKMIAPETMTCSATRIKMYLAEILEKAPESIYAVAHHLYDGGTSTDKPDNCSYDSFNTNLRQLKDYAGPKGYRLWQTEFYRGTALQTVNMINNVLTVENANAYIYWGGVWSSDVTNDMETNTLIPLSRAMSQKDGMTGYKLTGAYYAMRHFSEYIRPGYIRVQSSFSLVSGEPVSGLRQSSFISPDGKRIVSVLINNSASDLLIDLDSLKGSSSLVRQSVFTAGFTADMMYKDLGSVPADGLLNIPAGSVTTVVTDR